MKKSKLLKLITLPSIAMVIGVAPLTLCQCGSSSGSITPSIDPSVSSKVNISTTTDKDGNCVSTLSPKTTSNKITDVSVTIGSNPLTRTTDYEVSGLSSNAQSVVVTIFKATLNKYTGDIVIKPTIESAPATLTSISCTSLLTKNLNDSLKPSDITVIAHYSDSTSSTLSWNTGYKIYNSADEEITNFSSGFKLTTKGTITFKIKAVSDTTKIAPLSVKVVSEAIITFYALNGQVSFETITVDKGTLWSAVSKPIATPDYGYVNSVKWRKNSSSGTVIQDTDSIDDNMTIYACFEQERTTTICETKTHDTANTLLSPPRISYIPVENYDSTSTQYLVKRVEYQNDAQYTFKITLDENITNIKYFWIVQIKSSANELYMLHDSDKNIVSVKHDSIEVDYHLYSNNGGKYISLDSICTSGTIEITIAFHEDENLPLKFIPAFERAQ